MGGTPAGLLIKLLAAHLLGDYLFQSELVAKEKFRSALLGLHALAHGVLLALVGLTEPASPRLWGALAAVLALHVGIDAWTSRITPRTGKLLVLDQSLHVAALLGAVAWARPAEGAELAGRGLALLQARESYIVVSGLVAAIWAGAVVVGRAVEPFASQLGRREGLGRAGRAIGMAERALIFLAVLLRVEALVGFVVAAKAILRLPEAREAGHRELAEYYLVGTLTSVLWGVVTAVLTRWALGGSP